MTYQGDAVYHDDQPYATQDEYAEQAAEIAAQGQVVQPTEDQQWQPLGIFAMVKGDETVSNDIFQVAINKDGVVRGNYYNAVTDSTTPISGSLDKNSQRIAWTIEGSDETVYETGLYKLTLDEKTMLVHFRKNGEDHSQRYKLFRLQQPQQETAAANQK